MNDLRLAADLFGVLCELVIINYVFKYMMKEKLIGEKAYWIINGICLFLLTFITQFTKNLWVMPLSNFSVTIILSFFFRNKWYNKLFIAFVLSIIFVLSEIIIGTLLVFIANTDIYSMRDDFLSYVTGLLASKLLLYFLIKAFSYKKLDLNMNMRWQILVGLMLTPISSIVAMYAIGISLMHYEGRLLMLIVLATSVLLCISNYFVFYLFENHLKNEQTRVQLAFAKKQIDYQVDYYKDMSLIQSEIRTLAHDMKHYMAGVWGFIKEGNLNEANACIESIVDKLKSADSVFDTGYPALDAMLRFKNQRMDSNSIRFDSFIALPEQISVDVMDLCVILGNGLDNAIEACANVQWKHDKYVRLSMSVKSRYISISIENPTEYVSVANRIPRTNKTDTFSHGLGLNSIQAVTQKYDGSFNISCDNNVFKMAAMLNLALH